MIQTILNDKLKVSSLKETESQYRFNCLYCGDTKQRGNLYKENYHYHCYKCGTHRNLIEILDENEISLEKKDYDYILNIINRENLFRVSDELINELYSVGIEKSDFYKHYGLVDITEDKRSMRFIRNNLLIKFEDKFAYNEKDKTIYLLNKKNDVIIGYIILNLRNFGKSEKLTGLSEIYDEMELTAYISRTHDVLSKMINILDIDLNLPITIFDDVINSLFFKNSVFTVNNRYIFDSHDRRYFYANNKHGHHLRMERMMEKELVFDWKTFLKDNGIKNKIYDLHDLIKYQEKKGKKYLFKEYFRYD